MTENEQLKSEVLAQAIKLEQHHVDLAYTHLHRERDDSLRRLAKTKLDHSSSLPSHLTERDAFANHWAHKLERLSQVEDRLVFGRLDLEDGSHSHIGRLGLNDENKQQVLIDWRAPAAKDFYQATSLQPNGVVRRRHIATIRQQVVGIEDELLQTKNSSSANSDLELVGEGTLLAALSAARDGRMSDIVATIQREQDEIIRAKSTGVLVLQGGPGTGKTAVALHRAAYLLYQERERIENSGVLLVGPSRNFLQYISRVLPSLGESNVLSLTLGELLPGIRSDRHDPPKVAELKGRLIWSKILARAVNYLQTRPVETNFMAVQGAVLSLSPANYQKARARARQTGLAHNQAYETYANYLLDELAKQYAQAKNISNYDTSSWIYGDLRENRQVRRAINYYWLPYSATNILKLLFTKPTRLAAVAPEFSPTELKLLARPDLCQPLQDVGASPTEIWSIEDICLLDELEEILGPLYQNRISSLNSSLETDAVLLNSEDSIAQRTIDYFGLDGLVNSKMITNYFNTQHSLASVAEQALADRNWAFGHVVVDEAQELSPMAWRLLSRRCPSRSMTVVGDLDQRRLGAPPGGWPGLVKILDQHLHMHILTVSYRTPKTILELANSMLEKCGKPAQHPVTAARDVENAVVKVDYKNKSLIECTDAVLRKALEFLNHLHGQGLGNIAVIASDQEITELRAYFEKSSIFKAVIFSALQTENKKNESVISHPEAISGIKTNQNFEKSKESNLQRIFFLSSQEAKGLEFDVVILINPDEIFTQGVGDLFVALTRPTQRLYILYPGNSKCLF